jgi:hypothetical protein
MTVLVEGRAEYMDQVPVRLSKSLRASHMVKQAGSLLDSRGQVGIKFKVVIRTFTVNKDSSIHALGHVLFELIEKSTACYVQFSIFQILHCISKHTLQLRTSLSLASNVQFLDFLG